MTPVHSESQQKSLPLWSPSQQKIQKSALYAFIAHVNKKFGLGRLLLCVCVLILLMPSK